MNADAIPCVKDELGPLPFSTKHLIFLIWYLVPLGITCDIAYQLSGCSQEVLYDEGVDCREPTEGPTELLDLGKLPAPSTHTSTSSYPRGILTDGFSLCHDAFIKLVYSLFSTAGHLSHLRSLTVIGQAAEALEDMVAVFQ